MTTPPFPVTIAQELAGINDFLQSRVTPLEEEVNRLTNSVSQALATSREVRRAELMSAAGARPRVPTGPYAGMDALDLAIIRSLLTAQQRNPIGVNQSMIDVWSGHLTAAMDSTTPGAGDELVDTQEARTLWDDVNLETAVAPLFDTIQMPSNPFQIPLQLGDVHWYPGAENVSAKSTTIATNRQTLTAYELVAEIPWGYDLEEDSVIAMMNELRRSLLRNAREVIDDVLLNADSTPTNNINANGDTISSDEPGKAHWLLGFDGLLHLPLVDNTAQANNHNAAVSDDMFNEVRAKLGKYGVRPSDLAYICDIRTFIRSLGVDTFRTLDRFGPMATVLTGQLGAVEGIPVIVAEQMRPADTDGQVASGGNSADTGRLLIVNRTQWRVAFKRELTIETVRDPQKRQHIMVISFRIAFQERSADRSNATHTALQYNITGV